MRELTILLILCSFMITAFYLGLILDILAGWKKLRKKDILPLVTTPEVSIVIACRNEDKALPELLASLALQQYPTDKLEFIFVDDGSEDDTFTTLQQWRDKKQFSTRLLRLAEGSGKKQAVSLGVEAATAEWILCTDSDCQMGPAWIASMMSYTGNPEINMILGPVAVIKKPSWLASFQLLEVAGLLAVTAGAAAKGKAWMGNGANILYKKSGFITCNGLANSVRYASGDDVFLVQSFNQLFGGKTIQFAADKNAIVWTQPETSLIRLFWQRVRWASKSIAYQAWYPQFTSFIALVINLLLIVLCFSGLFLSVFWLVMAIVLIIKGILEYLLVREMTHCSGQKIHPVYFVLSQLVYPYYTAAIALGSLARVYPWKGRKQR